MKLSSFWIELLLLYNLNLTYFNNFQNNKMYGENYDEMKIEELSQKLDAIEKDNE